MPRAKLGKDKKRRTSLHIHPATEKELRKHFGTLGIALEKLHEHYFKTCPHNQKKFLKELGLSDD